MPKKRDVVLLWEISPVKIGKTGKILSKELIGSDHLIVFDKYTDHQKAAKCSNNDATEVYYQDDFSIQLYIEERKGGWLFWPLVHFNGKAAKEDGETVSIKLINSKILDKASIHVPAACHIIGKELAGGKKNA